MSTFALCGANLPPRHRGGPAASYQLTRALGRYMTPTATEVAEHTDAPLRRRRLRVIARRPARNHAVLHDCDHSGASAASRRRRLRRGRKRTLNRHELGTRHELATNEDVVLIPPPIAVDPRKSAAHGRIVRAIVDRAAAILIQRTSLVPNPRSPFTPSRLVDETGTVIRLDGRGFLTRQRRPMGAARGIVGTRITRQRRKRR